MTPVSGRGDRAGANMAVRRRTRGKLAAITSERTHPDRGLAGSGVLKNVHSPNLGAGWRPAPAFDELFFPGDGKGSRPGVRSKGERATIVVAKVASCA
jgi:hypothetical protein